MTSLTPEALPLFSVLLKKSTHLLYSVVVGCNLNLSYGFCSINVHIHTSHGAKLSSYKKVVDLLHYQLIECAATMFRVILPHISSH